MSDPKWPLSRMGVYIPSVLESRRERQLSILATKGIKRHSKASGGRYFLDSEYISRKFDTCVSLDDMLENAIISIAHLMQQKGEDKKWNESTVVAVYNSDPLAACARATAVLYEILRISQDTDADSRMKKDDKEYKATASFRSRKLDVMGMQVVVVHHCNHTEYKNVLETVKQWKQTSEAYQQLVDYCHDPNQILFSFFLMTEERTVC